MMNANDWLTTATKKLQQADIKTARLDALIILGEVLNASKAWLLSHPEAPLSAKQLQKADAFIQRRSAHEPIAYLFREKEFYGRTFVVDKRVLVPRPETEALLELALILPGETLKVADVGTGSGIIGLTLALERPKWQITLIDNDPNCLGLARQNAHKYALDGKITYRQQDLLRADSTTYDMLVANLPYVPEALSKQPDLQAEPATALFSGKDGLSHYRQIFALCGKRSNPPSLVITEALLEQHDSLARTAQQYGYQLQETKGLAQLFQR